MERKHRRVFGTSIPSSTLPQQQKRHDRNVVVDAAAPPSVCSSSTPPPFSGGDDKDNINDSSRDEDAAVIVETQTNDQVLQAKFDDAKKKGLVIAVDQQDSHEAVLVKFVNNGKNNPRLLEVVATLWYKDDNNGCLVYWDEIKNGQELDVWTFPGTKWYIYGGGGVRSSTKLRLKFTIHRQTTGNHKKQRIEF